VFEQLLAAMNAALDAAMPPTDWRDLQAEMRRAAVEGRAAVHKMKDDLAKAERELTVERRSLEDAERRGRLAAEIQDDETVEVAERFAAKHRERVTVIEQKVAAQRAELDLASREVEEIVAQLKEVERRGSTASASQSSTIPGAEDQAVRGEIDRVSKEAAAEERLRELKKRMGK
jgi:hypothetical protein